MVKTILPALFILFSCTTEPANEITPQPTPLGHPEPIETIAAEDLEQVIDTFILADLNYDKVADTAIVFRPLNSRDNPQLGEYSVCEDDSCVTRVEFSFADAVLHHAGALGFNEFFTTLDLNNDGIREIAFIPDWFQSCWSALFVYSLQNEEWVQLGAAAIYCEDEEPYEQRIRKISSAKFEIMGHEWNEDYTEIVDAPVVITLE